VRGRESNGWADGAKRQLEAELHLTYFPLASLLARSSHLRILDLGFKDQLNGILDYLPAERQTLLFSATQTRNVKDLARLSLNKPEYISVDEVRRNGWDRRSYVVLIGNHITDHRSLVFAPSTPPWLN